MTDSRMTRDQLLRRGAGGLTLLSLPSLLAACGGGGSSQSSTKVNDVLNFANWPLYIDTPSSLKKAGIDKPTTLQQFTTKTGIKVNYYVEINDNAGYFAKVQGRLARGQGASPGSPDTRTRAASADRARERSPSSPTWS